MTLKIPELVEVASLDRVTEVLVDAFADYPKLMNAFPGKYERLNALEASIRFYGQFDMYYGKAYTLDEDVFEVALIIESENSKTSKRRCLKAGCYSEKYQEIKYRMAAPDRTRRIRISNLIKKLEKTVPFPKKYLYVDYLGVATAKQDEGRGTELMEKICGYADTVGRPITLFINSDETRKFYDRFGFNELATVSSEKFGFTNTYLIREPKS